MSPIANKVFWWMREDAVAGNPMAYAPNTRATARASSPSKAPQPKSAPTMGSPSTKNATVEKATKKAVRLRASREVAANSDGVLRDISGREAAATLVANRATGRP